MNHQLAIYGTSTLLSVGKKLGSGGEGSVFEAVGKSSMVVKIYHNPPSPQHVDKLKDMIGLRTPSLLSISAWPDNLVCDPRSKAIVGFTMPRLTGCEAIQSLYNPVQRLRLFPKASWKFQTRAAHNLAAAFDEVHKSGCLVGDVNQGNALVTSEATIRLIDCDSFQISRQGRMHLCEVGVTHFTPPELQGCSFRGRVRTQNHDRFGLAVLIYQLIFAGRHPYQGIHADDSPFDQLIKEFRFSQGLAAQTWGMRPPPHTPIFDDIPADLSNLFRKSFERGSERDCRPRPADWMSSLSKFESSLSVCDADPGHIFLRGSKKCVWCRIAAQGGPDYFYGVVGGSEGFVVDEKKIQAIIRQLEQLGTIEPPAIRHLWQSVVHPLPKPIPQELVEIQQRVVQLRKSIALKSTAEAEISKIELHRKRREDDIRHKREVESKPLKEEMKEVLAVIEADSIKNRSNRRAAFVVSAIGTVLVFLGAMAANPWLTATGAVLCCSLLVEPIRSRLFPKPAEKRGRELRRLHKDIVDVYMRKERVLNSRAERACLQINDKYDNETMQFSTMMIEAESEFSEILDRVRNECRQDVHTLKRRVDAVESTCAAKMSEWDRDFDRHTGSTYRCVQECRGLGMDYQRELQEMANNSNEEGLLRHLRLHRIVDATIHKIGNDKKSLLEYSGIVTAADIEESAILRIHGFGLILTRRLLVWRNLVASKYRPIGAAGIPRTSVLSLTAKYRERQQRLLTEASQSVQSCESLKGICHESAQAFIAEAKKTILQLAQCESDSQMLASLTLSAG